MRPHVGFGTKFAFTLMTFATLVCAEPSAADRETARALMDDGDRKQAARDYEGALKAFLAADTIMNVPTTGTAVAKVYEEAGKLVEARDRYLAVSRSPVQGTEPRAFAIARREASERAVVLDGLIPSIRIEFESDPDLTNATITVDDSNVPSAAVSLPRRVNPGAHTVTAKKPGFLAISEKVALQVREQKVVRLKLVADPKAPLAPDTKVASKPVEGTPVTKGVDAPAASKTVGEPLARAEESSGYPVWGWVGVGVGGAGLIAGTIFGVLSSSNTSSAKEFCRADLTCDPAAQPFIDSAKPQATIANIAFGVGIAGAGVAIAAIFLGGKSADKTEKASVRLDLGPAYLGLKGAY